VNLTHLDPAILRKKERTAQIWYKHVQTNCINKFYFFGCNNRQLNIPQNCNFFTLQLMSLFYVHWSFVTWYIIKYVWRLYGRKGVIIDYIRAPRPIVGCFITTNFATCKAL
jgi:hypothetical protein